MNNLVRDTEFATMNKFSSDKKNEVLNLSKNIISNFNEESKSSLLIGRVQSGKTTTFINIIAAALNSDFQNVIVLTGTKNDLNDQTFDRIIKTFNQDVSYATDAEDKAYRINIFDVDTPPSKEEMANKNYKKIIVSKKGASTKKIIDLFGYGKTLVIDDESDHASNDTNATKKDSKRSTTNELLTRIFESKNAYYLAVTATPQSHSLMHDGEFNRPSKIFFVNAGTGYKGVNDFFEETSPIIRIVPEHEASKIKEGSDWTVDKNVQAIKIALVEFLIKVWALKEGAIVGDGVKKEDQIFENFNMMVNVDLANFKQEQADAFIDDFLNKLLNKHNDFLERYMTNKFVDELLEELCITEDSVDVAEKIKKMGRESIKIILLNKDSKNKNIPKSTSNIIIGGHSLPRGLTIENLIITYFIQDPKKAVAPTTLQRARWFGYRGKYFKYTRLFITRNILTIFKELMDVENILWDYAIQKVEHSVRGLQEVFANYSTVLVVQSNIAKYSKNVRGFVKYDSNFGDVLNKTHDEAFEWFNKYLKELADRNSFDHGVFISTSKISSILDTIETRDDNSVLGLIKNDLEELLKDHKTIRLMCFFNADDQNSYRGSKKGWDVESKYSPSGRNNNGKLNDLDYSLNKNSDEYNVPDIQFHPIWDKKTDQKKLFFAVFKENSVQNLEILHSKK